MHDEMMEDGSNSNKKGLPKKMKSRIFPSFWRAEDVNTL